MLATDLPPRRKSAQEHGWRQPSNTCPLPLPAVQVVTLLYPMVRGAAGDAAPAPEAFAAKLVTTVGFDAQLDYIASFKPEEVRASRCVRLRGRIPGPGRATCLACA